MDLNHLKYCMKNFEPYHMLTKTDDTIFNILLFWEILFENFYVQKFSVENLRANGQ